MKSSKRKATAATSVNALEAMMVMPSSKAIVRIQDGLAQKRSAATHLHQMLHVTWNNGAATAVTHNAPVTDYYVAMFRSALRAAVLLQRNPTPATPWRYNWLATLNGNVTERSIASTQQSDNGIYFSLPSTLPSGDGAIMEFVVPMGAVPNTTTQFAPHGPLLFAGRYGTRQGIWVDANNAGGGGTATITVTAFSSPGVGTNWLATTSVVLYRYQGDWAKYATNIVTAAAPTLSFTVNDPGYYTLGDIYLPLVALNTNPALFTVFQSTSMDSWGHQAIPQFTLNYNSVLACRILGYSALLSNRTAAQYKAGTMLGVSSDVGELWYDYMINNNGASPFGAGNTDANTSFNANLLEEDVAQFPAEKGIYAWGMLNQKSDIDWRTNLKFDEDSNTVIGGAFDIIDPAPFFVIQASIGQQVTGGQPDFFLQLDWAVEFHTQNQWFEQHMPVVTWDELEKAARICAKKPQFTTSMGA